MESFRSLRPDREIVWVDWYGHGEYGHGVLWATIEDSTGTRHCVCIDNRVDSSTRGRIFDGVRHPNKADAAIVEIGDEIEGDVVALLSNWCDNPTNWHSHGGSCRDEFKDVVVAVVLGIGAYS